MNMKKKISSLLAGLVFLSGTTSPVRAQQPQSAEEPIYQEGAFYVRLKKTHAPKLAEGQRFVPVSRSAALSSVGKAYGIHPEMRSMGIFDNVELSRTFLVEFDSTSRTGSLFDKLREMPEVEQVERIPVYRILGQFPENTTTSATEPKEEGSDPFYGTVNGTDYSWHLDMIHAEQAWEMQSGSPSVVVAVVDNAVWGSHPDLQIPEIRQYNMLTETVGNSAPPSSVKQGDQCSNMSNCYVYNWSHGTHCAGAIGAINKNGTGIASIGSGVSIMGVSCPGTDAVGLEVRNGFGGITYAAENGAKVISLSWGSYTIAETEKAIIQSCIDKGIVIVAAAGNNGYKDQPLYPANLPGVISVASVNSDKQISSFSNYGDWVSIAAPGGFIANAGKESFTCIFSTTFCQSQYYRLNGVGNTTGQYYDGMYGTSMATPVVSGLCGLLLSADSTLSPYLMREILISSSQGIHTGNGKNIQSGSGIIDAAAALNLLKDRKPMPRNLLVERKSNQIRINWEAPESQTPVKAYRVYRNGVFLAETPDLGYNEETGETGLYRYGVSALYENGDTSLRACADIEVPSLLQVETSLRPEGCGKVEGGGYYTENENIRLVATAAEGCQFVRWVEDAKVLGRDSILDYTVEFNTSIEAVFSGEPVSSSVLAEKEAGNIRIYPNPTQDFIHLESDSPLYEVGIYSMSGTRVIRKDFPVGENRTEIDTRALPSGFYVVKAFGPEGILIGKFSKK